MHLAWFLCGFSWLATSPLASATAQGGYTTEKHPELGLSFPRAKHYEAIPTQPDEEWVVLKFVEKQDVTQRKERRSRPEMQVVWIDWKPDPEPDLAEPPPPGPDYEGDQDAGDGKDEAEKPKPPPPPVTIFERFVDQKLAGWDYGPSEEGKKVKGWEGFEYPLYPSGKRRTKRVGWAFAWKCPQRTIAVIGFCDENDLAEQSKIWRKSAERMKITEPEGAEIEALQRYYERRGYSRPEFRIEVRNQLVRGWKVEDTENYIVAFSTKDKPLVRRICREIEQLRKEYIKLFPPAGEMTAVSTVRVCKSAGEYTLYGGPPGSAGYWNSQDEELVLFDFQKKEKKRRTSDTDTFIVLYHEAFHQFIHYSAGELPPHSWFNEGHGDFFSGALIKGGKVKKIGVNPWRVATIKRAVERREHVPLKEIIRYEQRDYYKRASLCYAQGWSLVYFLRTSKVVRKRDEWSAILPTYFDTLKQAYANELALAGNPTEKKARGVAGKKAREAAVETAFTGIDLRELEIAWIEFVEELEVPDRK